VADYTIANGTNAEFTNVNAGGTDVPAQSVVTGITLTNAELAGVAALDGAGVLQNAASTAEKQAVATVLLSAGGVGITNALAKELKLGFYPGSADQTN